MSYTTEVNLTSEVKKIQNSFDTLIAHKILNKQAPELSLTPNQYREYCAQIKVKGHVGNPFYKGIEIKRMGK